MPGFFGTLAEALKTWPFWRCNSLIYIFRCRHFNLNLHVNHWNRGKWDQSKLRYLTGFYPHRKPQITGWKGPPLSRCIFWIETWEIFQPFMFTGGMFQEGSMVSKWLITIYNLLINGWSIAVTAHWFEPLLHPLPTGHRSFRCQVRRLGFCRYGAIVGFYESSTWCPSGGARGSHQWHRRKNFSTPCLFGGWVFSVCKSRTAWMFFEPKVVWFCDSFHSSYSINRYWIWIRTYISPCKLIASKSCMSRGMFMSWFLEKQCCCVEVAVKQCWVIHVYIIFQYRQCTIC